MGRCLWVWLSLAAAALSSSGSALGQGDPYFPDPPRRPEMPRPELELPSPSIADAPGASMPSADPFQLLENSKEVQTELGLTQEQLRNLRLAATNFRNKLADLSRPQPGETQAQVSAAVQDHIATMHVMMTRELTPQQIDRLQQIAMQLEGPCALLDPQVARQLSLADQTLHVISGVCQRRSLEIRNAFKPAAPGEDPCVAAAANRDRIGPIRARADASILALLGPRERIGWARLMGPKIHLEPPIPPNCRL